MKCPTCNNSLQSQTYKKYILDFCVICGGIWFDEGELKDVIDSLISDNEVDYETVKEAFIGTHPYLNEPAIGASGAISGILGAYIILFPGVEVTTFWLGRIREISAYQTRTYKLEVAFCDIKMGRS